MAKGGSAELFAAVYEDPDDDDARAVLADALQEAGDPRGELIALQLARGRDGKKTRRESQLLKPNLRKWLGPLASAVPNKGLVYERGFAAKVQLHHHRDYVLPALGPPEWNTVEEVTPGVWNGSYQDLADGLPWLRVLNAIDRNVTAGMLPSHPKLQKIVVRRAFRDDGKHLAKLKLPALEELEIQDCHPTLTALKGFFDGLKSLRRLSVFVSEDEALPWIPWLAKQGFERAGVKATMNPWMIWFEGDRVVAQYRWSGHEQRSAGRELAAYLERVPTPKKWHLTVTQAFSWQGTTIAAIKRGLGTAAKGFASFEIVESETK